MTIKIPYKPRNWQKGLHFGMQGVRRAVVVAHRRAGKTVALINELLKHAVQSDKRDPFYAYVAPQYNQAKAIAWMYLKYFTKNIPGVKINESELWVMLPHNKAKIRLFGADNPNSLRGIYYDGIVLDEFADMHPEAWETVILPALQDRDGWAVLSGTPRGHNSFYEMYLHALQDEKWFVGMYKATEAGIFSDEQLEGILSEMTETKYAQEFLCDFDVADDDILIPLDKVMEAIERDGTDLVQFNDAPVCVGVDVARFGDDDSIIRARKGRDARTFPVKRFKGMRTTALASHVVNYAREVNADAVFIDGGGVGGGVVDRCLELGLDAIEVNFGSKATREDLYARKDAEMWSGFKEWLNGGILPNDNNFVAQATSRKYKFDANGRMVLESKDDMKKRGLSSPDDVDALVVTFAEPVVKRNYAEQVAEYFKGNANTSEGMDYDPLGGMR